MPQITELRIAIAAWEIGRAGSRLGVKLGGLGVIVEELPLELIKAASRQNVDLEIETLTPCFAHYDRSRLTKLELRIPVTLAGQTFEFEVYQHTFPNGQKVTYFWDEGQLSWTRADAIYPDDPEMALHLYASLSQAMAGYIEQSCFDTIHLHDYHVGLVPFYLEADYLKKVPVHFTIHNATYQGIIPALGGGESLLGHIHLSGDKLFKKYFDFFGHLNIMKASMIRVHETGGKVTTVSGDLAGTWGYAAELRESPEEIRRKALLQRGGRPPGEVFVPNRDLDVFEKIPVAGITNGMSDRNSAPNLPELKAAVLQKRRGAGDPIFRNPTVQSEMLAKDHNFDAEHLEIKAGLKRLLHLETFGAELLGDPILLTAVGRLVAQKNLGLVAHVVERTLEYDAETKFIILASAPEGDPTGKTDEASFSHLADMYPELVYFDNSFNPPLSKLIFAGGDFSLIPSRFEPCGLVDYESSLLGNIVIGRATGGLTKVRQCAYLYAWLDVSDRAGEANAFFEAIKSAIDVYRHDRERHVELVRKAMSIDASWDTSAEQYVKMYRFGLLTKEWQRQRGHFLETFVEGLGKDRALFSEFFAPGHQEYADTLDWELKGALQERGARAAGAKGRSSKSSGT